MLPGVLLPHRGSLPPGSVRACVLPCMCTATAHNSHLQQRAAGAVLRARLHGRRLPARLWGPAHE